MGFRVLKALQEGHHSRFEVPVMPTTVSSSVAWSFGARALSDEMVLTSVGNAGDALTKGRSG